MSRPSNVGIKAIEVFIPRSYITQDDLEERDIAILGEEKRAQIKGKYTKGLGQTALAFCTDREDTVSNALNAVSSLFAKYNLNETMFGRLEAGTESGVDKSKSIKSFLMQLFPTNRNVMGIDNTNACYGGTAALMNSLAWVESSQWDGRLALVVATDIAVYEEMAARPTGGCGAVAMVIGPDAPIVIEPGVIASYFAHGYDFFKPNPANPHPVVDGPLSLLLYYECLDGCYFPFKEKAGADIDGFDYVCFHTPFLNLIKKCTGRLAYLKGKKGDEAEIAETRQNAKFMSELSAANRPLYEAKVVPSTTLSSMCGNGYTASLYMAIASLIDSVESLSGKRVLCFSYGSGAASTMFSIKVVGDVSAMRSALNLKERLAARNKRTVEDYEQEIEREKVRYVSAPYEPVSSLDLLWENEWYLDSIDAKWHRIYKQRHL